MLTVDAKIDDELFFQIWQDFTALKDAGDKEFGNGNYSVVLVDTYSETLKDEIRKILPQAVFLGENTLEGVPQGNIVTVNASLTKLAELQDRTFLLLPALTDERIAAILECLRLATEREKVESHIVLVK